MKRALALVLALGALCLAGPAAGATPTDKKIAALQKQVKMLQAQVTTLTKKVNSATSEVQANYVGDACSDWTTASLFQKTWSTIDTKRTEENGAAAPWFGDVGAPVNDKNACRNILGSKPTIPSPPGVSIFIDIINWLI